MVHTKVNISYIYIYIYIYISTEIDPWYIMNLYDNGEFCDDTNTDHTCLEYIEGDIQAFLDRLTIVVDADVYLPELE